MKHKIQKVELFVGVIVLLGGLLTYGLGVHQLLPVPRPDLVVYGTTLIGIILPISSTGKYSSLLNIYAIIFFGSITNNNFEGYSFTTAIFFIHESWRKSSFTSSTSTEKLFGFERRLCLLRTSLISAIAISLSIDKSPLKTTSG